MQKYSIVITKLAEQDMDNIVSYLFHQFGELTARKYRKLFQNTCQKLSFLPTGTAPIDEDVFGFAEIRKINVKKYVIFYEVDKSKKIVNILRVKHVLMDWRNMPLY